LYAEEPGEAVAAIGAHAAKAFKDLQRLYGRLFVPENIPHSVAVDHVAGPRKGFRSYSNISDKMTTM
jgi:hypothetical protein